MRDVFALIFILLIPALSACAFFALRSGKSVAKYVAYMILSLIPPIAGNIVIVLTTDQLIATAGYYIYFLGMDLMAIALLKFTFSYCVLKWPSRSIRFSVYAAFFADVVQYIVNIFTHHAFETEESVVDGEVYYKLVPYLGQTYHRVICYGVILAVLVIFVIKTLRSPRVYAEKYYTVLITMTLVMAWETFYIFSRTPIDQSMIGFGIFGICIFYLSIIYRPLRLLDRMLANIASQLSEALFFFDSNRKCIWANRPGIDLLSLEGENFETAEADLRELFGEISVSADDYACKRVIGEGPAERHYIIEKQTVYTDTGRIMGSFISIRDNTEEELALKREKYNATHDPLTGIYTREHLYKSFGEFLREKPDAKYCVLYADVIDFKIINDIFGNDYGDFVLKSVADFFRKRLPEGCFYGRLVGDTFGICMPSESFRHERVEEILTNFFVTRDSVDQSILIHVGVYEVTETDLDVSVMFDRARMALAEIKDNYKVHISYYDDDMRRQVLWNQHISTQLRDAISGAQVIPYLQPIVDSDGRVVGAEALVRWDHPEDGFLAPGSFIPVFEKNGMIADLDKHMWKSACEILAGWKEKHPDLFISVNISPKDFYFMDVASEIKTVAEEYGIAPSNLRIEITETFMMTEADKRINILCELRDAGFIVEMDDFGSGYSSLNLLKDMPVDVIKIDMGFLQRSPNGDKANTILHNIINLSRDLGIMSLTEGVETPEQYRMLTEMGCRLFQGYYFSRPMPVTEFERSLLT